MKLSVPDSYNVAWFKLAECISRGEKERALGVYRLLAHSLNDNAFATQLEADILLYFNKNEALEKYQQAADQYIQNKYLFKAACVYEHMLTIAPGTVRYKNSLVDLYTALQMHTKADEHKNIIHK